VIATDRPVIEARVVDQEIVPLDDLDADIPRQPPNMLPEDWWMLGGSAAAALSLTWLVFYRLLPIEGAVGFWVVTWLAFLAVYAFTVRAMADKLAAKDRVVAVVLWSVALGLLTVLVLIVGYSVVKGLPGITPAFFTQTLEDVGPLDPESKGGALHAIVGTLQQLGLTVTIAVPFGILTAVFLNEVGGRMARPVRIIVDAMSGVPSIVAGLFVYSALIVSAGWGFSGFAASLALGVLMLPTVTRACEVVLRLVPDGLREAALALGAPRWRVVLQVVLPTARSGVSTSVILGMARSVGETAPLILTAFGASIVNSNPFSGPQSALPLYIWQLVRNSDPGQQRRAWAAAFALIVLVLLLFSLARSLGRSSMTGGRAGHAVVPAVGTVAALDPAFAHLAGGMRAVDEVGPAAGHEPGPGRSMPPGDDPQATGGPPPVGGTDLIDGEELP
jgi:phosphate transport system permease protein